MLLAVFLLLAVLSSPCIVTPSKTVEIIEFYVTPNSLASCPQGEERCNTLKNYTTNTTAFNGIEAFSLVFLDGVHNLPKGEFKISDKVAVSMVRYNNSGMDFSNPQVVINCMDDPCAISLSNIESIELRELHFQHAAFNDSHSNKHTLNATLSLKIDKVIFESAIVEIHSEGVNAIFIVGGVFNKSPLSIEYNLGEQQSSNERPICMIQNTVFKDAPSTSSIYYKSSIQNTELNIKNVTTSREIKPSTIKLPKGPGDITVTLMSTVRVHILNFTQCNVTQSPGYGIYIETPNTGDGYQMTFDNVTISGNNEGGLAIINYSPYSQQRGLFSPSLTMRTRREEAAKLQSTASKQNTASTGHPYTTIDIVNCGFRENKVQHATSSWLHTYINNIHISHNSLASSLIITDYGEKSEISIVNTIFEDNNDTQLEPVTALVYNTQNVYVERCRFQWNIGSHLLVYNTNVRIQDSIFDSGKGSAIQAYLSEITLSGYYVYFMSNSAYRGGAIALFLSHLKLQHKTKVKFRNNKAATVGGAIIVEQESFSQTEQCFYQIDNTCNEDCDIQIEFTHNTAQKGGNNLYGASLKSDCFVNERNRSYEVWSKYYRFESDNSCNVTSDPKRVCFCDLETTNTRCTELSRNIRLYPGKSFTVPLAVVGDDFGATTGSLYATFMDTSTRLEQLQETQWVDHIDCSQLNYTVFSTETHGNKTLVLRVEANKYHEMKPDILDEDIAKFRNTSHITDELLSTPVHINVILEDCPLGFKLQTNKCACSEKLKQFQVKCDTSTGTIDRSGSTWVGYNYKKGEVIAHAHCPHQYCNETHSSVSVSKADTQCAFNRSGILCGQCTNGTSLMIGSSQCSDTCTHRTLALITFFVASGIFLVVFLKLLDLTVARGTLNGLILYANILWANQSALFPNDNGPLQYFLKPFIAWLNLDFGIETCFFEGLNDYIKAWLQFLFPLYIWTIVGLIIVAAHYIDFVANRLGRNSVQVLATLVFLSYTKLLRTIIIAVEWRTLNYTNGSTAVWAADGNIDYFSLEHGLLFGVTVLTLVIFWTPYTLVLFFHQWLKKVANHRRLRWIITWKAFFEAYFGPLKDEHNYWVGLMLLVRCFLLLIFAVTSPKASLLAMTLTMTVILVYMAHTGSVYKNQYLSLLENSFILNLIVVGAGMLYIKTEGVETWGTDPNSEMINVNMQNIEKGKTHILYASIITAFLQFIGIVIYHIWTKVKQFREQRGHGEGDNPPAANKEDERDDDMDARVRWGEESENNTPLSQDGKQDPDTY